MKKALLILSVAFYVVAYVSLAYGVFTWPDGADFLLFALSNAACGLVATWAWKDY